MLRGQRLHAKSPLVGQVAHIMCQRSVAAELRHFAAFRTHSHADDRARLWFFNAVSHGVGVAHWIGNLDAPMSLDGWSSGRKSGKESLGTGTAHPSRPKTPNG